MKKKIDERKTLSLISLFVSIFVYLGALGIFFYANGWRVDPLNRSVFKTGVLNVQSDPFLANLYVNERIRGRTPKSVSLPIGIYDVSVSRNGYRTWRKDVEIKEEKSTPVYPWLIREDIVKQEIFLLQDSKYINSWNDDHFQYSYFLVNTLIPTTSLTNNNIYSYSLYRFDLNTSFWDMSNNPQVVLAFEFEVEPEIDLNISPNGLLAIMTIKQDESIKYYLLDSTKSTTLDSLKELNLGMFPRYTTTWSQNSQYLMLESENDLISFDILKETRYLLLKKNGDNPYVWTTDQQGFFYKLVDTPNEMYESVYSYSLVQEQMDGSSPKTLIEEMFFHKNKDFIAMYQQDTGSGKYAPFKNSPESTKSVGKVEEIVVNQSAKGIYIQTETSSYWYNMDTQRYHLVSPYTSSLISFSPDNYKLLFKTNLGFSIFTFMKESGDHTVDIGSKPIRNLTEKISHVNWVSNSLYLWYLQDNNMCIVDIDGENQVDALTDIENTKYIALNASRDRIYTLVVSNLQEDIDRITLESFLIR